MKLAAQMITGWLAIAFLSSSCAQPNALSDASATKETVNLFKKLNKSSQEGYLIGHQDDLAYGVNWKYQPGRSDIKEVTGDYPALYGWELGGLEKDSPVDLDSVPFTLMKQYIREGYQRGGAITISWHGNNPLTDKTAWDPAPGTVASILPGGPKHEVFVQQLNKIAAFLADLKGSKGETIPVLYRPFHELTGNWFWWGANSCTPDEFKQLFRFTVNYLRTKKHLHNLIIVYNTSGDFKTEDEFLQRYPGDDVVDVVSFDTYQYKSPDVDKSFADNLSKNLTIVEEVAQAKHKLPALAETGFSQIPYPNWWTGVLATALQNRHPAYVLLWRNAGYKPSEKVTEYYAPYKGQVSEQDFIKFYQLPQTLFEKDAARLKLYK
ncbi:glycoside hydrolase family 26 protein [Mucilaginibacter lacusdianchii]|uniref:glycoside hydrolase family 26 protein n=1 Tax=Mucilaginibacter lacusdianchii TaxID=2684211 RepID=UPI0018EF3357|nr:glycosyl hydrolase [Mucilaginibacter sp. JXJ CY 39]